MVVLNLALRHGQERRKGRREESKEIFPASPWLKRSAGKLVWRSKWPPAPRLLYGLEYLAHYPEKPVLVLEGEGKCDATNELKDFDYVAIAFSGGSKRVRESDLSPLATPRAVVWPDNDKTGLDAAMEAARATESAQLQVRGAITDRVEIVKPDPGWPSGHDIGDLIESGWSARQLLDYIVANSVGVEMLEQHERDRFSSSTETASSVASHK